MSKADIFIVEDEHIMVELLQGILCPLGYRIVAVSSSGEDAIQRVAETLPNLVLMDIHLQGELDGIETAERILEHSDIPIVYLTAHANPQALERAKITAPFGFVLKPLREKELHMAIEIALYRHDMEKKFRALNDGLEQRVEERTAALQKTNQDLQESIETLHTTLTQLAHAEKMAALGGLVAGMTHEMSNPLGISVMAVSHLEENTRTVQHQFTLGALTRPELQTYLKMCGESAAIIQKNLYRTSDILNSFKQMAIDQVNERRRKFFLLRHIEENVFSLRPRLKPTRHLITVDCPAALQIYSYPGVFSQILTNLIMNSLIHGFEQKDTGHIHIQAGMDEEALCIHYQDDGKGIPEEHLDKLFDLFYTTKREEGSSGLGLNIVSNLIRQKLGGTIRCESTEGKGASFFIDIPAEMLHKG